LPIPGSKLQTFLKYKEAKLQQLANIESERLKDLKDARATIFKYALPTSLIDGVGGVIGTLLTNNILVLLPVSIFVILIYFLADGLDRKKLLEREDIMEYTEIELFEVAKQETALLKRVEK
jgi:hypothetical protein